MKKNLLVLALFALMAANAAAGDNFSIYVKTLTGKTIELNDVNNGTTIQEVKEKIFHKEGIFVEKQRLRRDGGKLLRNDQTLSNYDIKAGSTLTVVERRHIKELAIIDPDSKKTFVIEDSNLDDKTVADLKNMVAEAMNISSDTIDYFVIPQTQEQISAFNNDKQLKDIPNLTDGDQLHLHLKSAPAVVPAAEEPFIFVKTLTGTFRIVGIDKNSITKKVKEKIFDQKGFPVDQQLLIFQGRQLEDDQKLADHGIEEKSTLHLVLRPNPQQPVAETKPQEEPVAQTEQLEVSQQEEQEQQEETSTPAPSKSTLKKPMSKMTSREIAQLKYNDLTAGERKEIDTMAVFSGVEANRSAARKVIQSAHSNVDWAKVTADFKKHIRDKFEEFMPNPDQSASTSSLKKAIEKMSGREIGALKYENLTAEQQEKLFEMALFSGLEDYRSAARKVIDAYRAANRENKLDWDKELSAILAE